MILIPDSRQLYNNKNSRHVRRRRAWLAALGAWDGMRAVFHRDVRRCLRQEPLWFPTVKARSHRWTRWTVSGTTKLSMAVTECSSVYLKQELDSNAEASPLARRLGFVIA